MGAPTVRIAEDDFLIPPEFTGLRLAGHTAGQLGGVRLELTAFDGKTRLAACYHQVPLQVLPPFHFAGEPAALLYLINPTVGLLDGDGHLVEIIARSGTRTVVTGQSAARIHPALNSFAAQQWRVRVEDDAELVILPGPAIPYRGSRYFQSVAIDLAAGARFIWGDIWLPGRYLRDDDPELHVFDRVIQELHVRREGKLVFRDRFDWRGPWDAATRSWHQDAHLASASLFVTGTASIPDSAADSLDRAVMPLSPGDTCIRCCGEPSAVIRECVRLALGMAGAWDKSDAAPWLTSNNFGPNHWFSSLST